MANIPEPAAGFVAVYQLETTDKALAGASGVMNTQAAQLMARDNYLAQQTIPVPSPLVVDTSVYYTGSAWASYAVTSVGRTLLAATTQAAQKTALGLGDASVQNIGTSGANVPLLNGANTWGTLQVFFVGLRVGVDQVLDLGGAGAGMRGNGSGAVVLFGTSGAIFRPGGNMVTTGQLSMSTTETTVSALLAPSTDNAIDVGLAARRIRTYYGVNSAINTSDARLKTEPRQLLEAERKAASALARLPCIWAWLTGDRLHAGPTVQAAIAVMEAHGLDPFAYSFICYDEWEAEEATYDDKGNELKAAREAGNRYSFRKEELLCFMVPALAAEHDALDARLTALENR